MWRRAARHRRFGRGLGSGSGEVSLAGLLLPVLSHPALFLQPSDSRKAGRSIDYEKGSPAWDIGQILTIHAAGHQPGELVCDRVAEIRRTAVAPITAMERLQSAQAIPCTCGREIITAETTTLRREREDGRRAIEASTTVSTEGEQES